MAKMTAEELKAAKSARCVAALGLHSPGLTRACSIRNAKRCASAPPRLAARSDARSLLQQGQAGVQGEGEGRGRGGPGRALAEVASSADVGFRPGRGDRAWAPRCPHVFCSRALAWQDGRAEQACARTGRGQTCQAPPCAPSCATAARPPCLRLAWVSLAWASLAWVSLAWVSLVWVRLVWVSLAGRVNDRAGLGQPNLTQTRSDPAPIDPYRKFPVRWVRTQSQRRSRPPPPAACQRVATTPPTSRRRDPQAARRRRRRYPGRYPRRLHEGAVMQSRPLSSV